MLYYRTAKVIQSAGFSQASSFIFCDDGVHCICCVKVERVDKRALENCGSRAGIRQFQCELPLFPLLSLSNLENTALKNDAPLLRTGS